MVDCYAAWILSLLLRKDGEHFPGGDYFAGAGHGVPSVTKMCACVLDLCKIKGNFTLQIPVSSIACKVNVFAFKALLPASVALDTILPHMKHCSETSLCTLFFIFLLFFFLSPRSGIIFLNLYTFAFCFI